LVYIRNKKVKGLDYGYLVQSKWDHENNTSKQVTIKYLGKTSDINPEDIPAEYRNDPKIIAFISTFGNTHKEKEKVIPKLQNEIFELCMQCNTDGLVNTYKEYSKLFNLVEFYDKLLKPVLYKIGDLWKQGKLDVATEHASTNTINSFVKVIEEQVSHKINTTTNVRTSICKIMICTPEGELHNVSCNLIESLLVSRGYKVYNISPSVPADSVITYIENIEPDIILISVTNRDNIKAAERLIKQIVLRFDNDDNQDNNKDNNKHNKIPIVVGGLAFSDYPENYLKEDEMVLMMQNASFEEIIKLIDFSTAKKTIR
jgi:methanogenic corrinoid protein MtbC1